jgi:hypothetical protein
MPSIPYLSERQTQLFLEIALLSTTLLLPDKEWAGLSWTVVIQGL